MIFPIVSFASWVIINDDGTTEVYNEKKIDAYIAPKKKKKSIVKKQIAPKYTYTGEKIMYLTFDDGPLLGSENIIDIIQEEGVLATMFMVGKHIKQSKYRKRTFNRALNEPLILVANHTYTHASGRYRHFYSDTRRVVNDINKMDNLLFNSDLNYQVPYLRLAGRNVFRLPTMHYDDPGIPKRYNEREKYDALWDEGYQIFGWDYQWSYNPKNGKVNKTPRELVSAIERIYNKNRTKKSGKFILLMHDFSFRDRFNGKKDLRELIRELKNSGWSFETLSTYL